MKDDPGADSNDSIPREKMKKKGKAAPAPAAHPAENKMGYAPCRQLLFKMALPIVIAMLTQALYNVVDSAFVAMISEQALTAVSMSFPMQLLVTAITDGTGVGVNARLSRKLGEKKQEGVNFTAGNAILIGLVYTVFFFVVGTIGARVFHRSLIDDPVIISYGSTYISIVVGLGGAVVGQMFCGALLQATGRTFESMLVQATGCIANCILDPIMIFGLLGCPAMGVAGAAYATVIGQLIGTAVGIYLNLTRNKEVQFGLKFLAPRFRTIREIYAVGFPTMIMQSLSSVTTFVMNKILVGFTPTAVAVYGAYFDIQSFVFLPVYGVNDGVVPIVSYNFGARNPDRIKETFKWGVIYSTAIMLFGMFMFMGFPGPLLKIFSASENMLHIGIRAFRIIAIGFVFVGFSVTSASMFQALGHGNMSLASSVIRMLALLLPLAYLFSRIGGLDYVWCAYPVAEAGAAVYSVVAIRYIMKKQVNKLYHEEQSAEAGADAAAPKTA